MKSKIQTVFLFAILLDIEALSSCSSNDSNGDLIASPSGTRHIFKQFKESANTAVLTTKFIVNDNKPITLVRHNPEDSTWEFFSDDKYDNFTEVVKIIGLGQLVKIDNSVLEIADMKLGYYAHRKTKKENWIVDKLKEK